MARDSMEALLRLRQLAVGDARRDLAACIAVEVAAQEAVKTIEAAVMRETAAACRLDGSDQVVESFAAWLQRMRPSAAAAEAAMQAAALRTTEARAVLAAARSAAESVEALLAHHAVVAAALAAAAEQHALDEAAGRATAASARPSVRHPAAGLDGL